MGKKIDLFEDIKKKYVRMALETNHYTSTAKAAGISRSTLNKWMQTYETEIMDQMDQENPDNLRLDSTSNAFSSEETKYKEKYLKAMQLLGEKELEVSLLKDVVKKTNHP